MMWRESQDHGCAIFYPVLVKACVLQAEVPHVQERLACRPRLYLRVGWRTEVVIFR